MTADHYTFACLWFALFPTAILCLQYGVDLMVEDLTPGPKNQL